MGDHNCADESFHSLATAMINQKMNKAGFQKFTVASDIFTSGIPDSIVFENAVVLPLGLATAAAGLFSPEYLALTPPLPSVNQDSSVTDLSKKFVLIWGGSSSVGNSAIQLLAAAGFTIVTTASPKNHEGLKALGASYVFDYSSSNSVKDIIKALDGHELIGVYDTISTEETSSQCAEIRQHFGGGMVLKTGAIQKESDYDGNVKYTFGECYGNLRASFMS